MRQRKFSNFIGLALVLAGAPGWARADCPLNNLLCFNEYLETTASVASLCGTATYDLTKGWMRLAAGGGPEGGFGRVVASDEYRVTGLPDGTALVFEARLLVVGEARTGCGPIASSASARVTLAEGVGNEATVLASVSECGKWAPIDSTIHVNVACESGELFTLSFNVIAAGRNGTGSATAQLSFAGLPTGARVESCQGFAQDPPVATRRSTWGTIKLAYR